MDFISLPSAPPYRGVVVWNHGSGQGGKGTPVNLVFGSLQWYVLQLVTNLNADGWIVIGPPQNADNGVGGGASETTNIQPTILADTGLLFTSHTLQWWDHVVSFIHTANGSFFAVM